MTTYFLNLPWEDMSWNEAEQALIRSEPRKPVVQSLKSWLLEQESRYVLQVVAESASRREAAQALGISLRSLYYKLRIYERHNLRVAGA